MYFRTAARRALLSALLATMTVPAAAQRQDILTLNEALERAGIEAPALAEAQANIGVAQGEAVQAGLAPNPQIGVDVENIGGSGAFRGLRSTETTLALSQRLELGGKRGARRNAAQAQVAVAELTAALTQAELALAVRERFIEAVAAQAKIELAANVVERSRDLARISQALVDAGREPPLRALRANAAVGEAEAELAAQLADGLSSKLALAALWGGSNQPPQLPAQFPQIVPPNSAAENFQALELRLAAAERFAAEAAVRREERFAIPDLTVSAGVRRFEATNDQAFVVGASIALPFRDRNQGNISAAEAGVTAAAAREARARAQFAQRISSAQAQYSAAKLRVETISKTSLPQAEEALRLARIGYRYGRFTLIDVLDAAAARDTSQRSLIDARTALDLSAAQLLRLAATQETIR